MYISSNIHYVAPDLELSAIAPQGIIAASVNELTEYNVEEETW